MASGLTPSKANSFVNEISGYLSNSSYPVYAALSTTTPTVDGDIVSNITEPSTSGTGYHRIKLTPDQISAAVGGSTSNKATIVFDEVTASWGTVTHIVLYTTLTGGTPIAIGQLTGGGLTPSVGSMPIIRTGNFTMTMSTYS